MFHHIHFKKNYLPELPVKNHFSLVKKTGLGSNDSSPYNTVFSFTFSPGFTSITKLLV